MQTVCPLLLSHSDTDVTFLGDEAEERRSAHVKERFQAVKFGVQTTHFQSWRVFCLILLSLSALFCSLME